MSSKNLARQECSGARDVLGKCARGIGVRQEASESSVGKGAKVCADWVREPVVASPEEFVEAPSAAGEVPVSPVSSAWPWSPRPLARRLPCRCCWPVVWPRCLPVCRSCPSYVCVLARFCSGTSRAPCRLGAGDGRRITVAAQCRWLAPATRSVIGAPRRLRLLPSPLR
jgi:hypothetical protein